MNNVFGGATAKENIGIQFLLGLDLIAKEDPLTRIEVVQELFGGVSKRFQKHRHGEFPAAVDAIVENIFGIEFKVEPGAAKRDDARRVQNLPAGVGFSSVMIEENPRRTMQLAHHDPLGAVDNEGPIVGHQRQRPEIDFLFLDVANRAGAGFFVDVVDDQAHHDFQGGFVGHSPRQTFFDIVFDFAKTVLNKLQRSRATEILNGENALENFLESSIASCLRRDIPLQKLIVAFLLHLNQIRDARRSCGSFRNFSVTDIRELGPLAC